MVLVPNLSCLTLHEYGDRPVAIGTHDTPPSKRAQSHEEAPTIPNGVNFPKLSGGARAPTKTLVAKLLKDRGSNRNAWGKGTAEFLPGPMSFPALVRYLRDNTTYESPYQSIRDLRNFPHWKETDLLPNGLICNEMDDAMEPGWGGGRDPNSVGYSDWLARMVPWTAAQPKRTGHSSNSGWLARMVPEDLSADKGYYTRRDWSNKIIFVLGDFHGSLHSLLDVFLDMIDQGAFKTDGSGLLADDVAVVCLGDLLDRSPYTLECFYLMLRLCRENPGNCVLTAGNHETDQGQWEKPNGTAHEIREEKGDRCPTGTKTFTQRMKRVTQALPSALIVKTSLGTLQMNHGSYEDYDEGSPEAEAFLKFVRFDPMTTNALETKDPKAINPLQWADVAVDPAPITDGRVTRDAEAVAGYLKMMGLSMLMRGHSDLANLSLLYAKGHEPPAAVQNENAVAEVSADATYPNYGHPMKDPRPPVQREARGNTFMLKGHDFTMEPLYNMYTLHQAPDAENFDKHLVTEEDGAQELLVVTVASCPFSKPMPPVSMMSCYLAIGAPARRSG